MAMNKRKTTTTIVAGVTAVALLLGGTFAWTSIQQEAKNEKAGVVNVGGRLHDDFDGKNKDVYVENFTDPLDGGQPIYARVRLDEYMEVGKDAGGIDVDNDGKIDAVPVVSTADRDEVSTWTPHVPSESCEECNTNETCKIHEYWKWTMGNEDPRVFMPTFNKDKDSLEADINGKYHGTDDTDKVYYDDYVEYVVTGGAEVDLINGTVNGVAPAEIPAGGSALTEADGQVTTVIGNAQYDNDPDDKVNETENDDYILVPETHTAKETATAEVILMDAWDGTPGNFWVYDTDGWAYWAYPIMPGEATGLLLDQIEMQTNPGEKCYYAINVVAQFATVGDWEYFNGDETNPAFDGTDKALELLESISQNVPTVTVTNTSGKTTFEPGETATFDATVTLGPVAPMNKGEWTWSVLDANHKVSETSSIDEEGVLKIGMNETSSELIIVARSTTYGGAVGISAIAVNVSPLAITAEVAGVRQYLTVGGVEEEDYPLVFTLYKLATQDAAYSSGEVVVTLRVEPGVNEGTLACTWEGNTGTSSAKLTEEPGTIELDVNVVFDEDAYMGVMIEDAQGQRSFIPEPLFIQEQTGCFEAGTQVLTENGLVAIETVTLDDKVWAVDMATNEKTLADVIGVYNMGYTEETYTIYVADEVIVSSPEHPFYVDGAWVAASELKAGDVLTSMNGSETVIEKIEYKKLDEPLKVYNLAVAEHHNFLITEAELLVHNLQK